MCCLLVALGDAPDEIRQAQQVVDPAVVLVRRHDAGEVVLLQRRVRSLGRGAQPLGGAAQAFVVGALLPQQDALVLRVVEVGQGHARLRRRPHAHHDLDLIYIYIYIYIYTHTYVYI